jgi:hypothetical protein
LYLVTFLCYKDRAHPESLDKNRFYSFIFSTPLGFTKKVFLGWFIYIYFGFFVCYHHHLRSFVVINHPEFFWEHSDKLALFCILFCYIFLLILPLEVVRELSWDSWVIGLTFLFCPVVILLSNLITAFWVKCLLICIVVLVLGGLSLFLYFSQRPLTGKGIFDDTDS